MNKYEREAERIFKAFDDAREALAARIRTEVVLPACRKHRVTFMAGNGSFSFYILDDEVARRQLDWMNRTISNDEDCLQHKRAGLRQVLHILNMECGEKFEIGNFVADVSADDLK